MCGVTPVIKKHLIAIATPMLLLASFAQAEQKTRTTSHPTHTPGLRGAPGTQSGGFAGRSVKKGTGHPSGVPGVEGAPGTQSGARIHHQ